MAIAENYFNLDDFMAEATAIRYGEHIDLPKLPNHDKGCGKLGHRRNPATGGVKLFKMRCGNFRECSACFEHRMQTMVGKMIAMRETHGTDLVEMILDDDKEYRKIRDTYGSDHVLRFPLIDGSVVVMIAKHGEPGDVLIEPKEILEDDLAQLVFTPKGKNISGGIQPKKEKREGETITVQVSIFAFDAPGDTVAMLEKLCIQATSHLRPHDQESLQDAILSRDISLQNLAMNHNIGAYCVGLQWVTVYLEDLDWSNPKIE